jgi:hypothetical protein
MQPLAGIPRPHYLTKVDELSHDGKKFKGWVMFPSSDETIGDRRDHVNQAHHLFAVWNAAHVMCEQAGFKNPRAYETTTVSRKPTKPDISVLIEVSASIEQTGGKRISGTISAAFYQGTRKVCEVTAKFIAQRS